MTDATRFQFNDPSVPKAYDELLVPRLFAPWVKLLLDEAGLRPGECVLDVVPPDPERSHGWRLYPSAQGRIVATDIAQPMLDIAKGKIQPPTSAPIEYLQSPAPRRTRARKLVMAAPHGHHLTRIRGRLTLKQIVDVPLIIYPNAPRPSYADQVLSFYRKRGLEPKTNSRR